MPLIKLFRKKKLKEDQEIGPVEVQTQEPVVDPHEIISSIRKDLANNVYLTTNRVGDGLSEMMGGLENAINLQESTFKALDKLKESIESAGKTMETADKQIKSLDDSLGQLKEMKNSIDSQEKILGTLAATIHDINDIGSRVKILSFNTSLEASRAGVAGRSFMVVADEIQRLSLSTNEQLAKMKAALDDFSSQNKVMNDRISNFVDEEIEIIEASVDLIQKANQGMTEISQELSDLSTTTSEHLEQVSNIKNESSQRAENLNYEMSQLIDETLGTSVQDLTVTESLNQLQRFITIDVRRQDEYFGELGHIEGADLATLGDDLKVHLQDLDKDKDYLFVCRSGGRSARAARVAQLSGFKSVFNMKGGMLEWNAKSLPISKGMRGAG